MFENDRFGPEENYSLTYEELGGVRLTGERLRGIIDGLVFHMLELGRDPNRYDSFPSVSEALGDIAAGLDPEEVDLIEELVARHEVGLISSGHADVIRCLSTTHRLGIVSNIWGRKGAFERNLADAGIRGCFEHAVWSSELGRIKPSANFFRHALGLFGVAASRVLVVGDHPFRDVVAARNSGCSTVWVRNEYEVFPEGVSPPDLVIADLGNLLDAI